MRWPTRVVLANLAAALLTGCGASDPIPAETGAGSTTMQPLRYVIDQDLDTHLTVQGMPDAVCFLNSATVSDQGGGLELYSDHEGVLHFSLHPDSTTPPATSFRLDCHGPTGAIASLPIDVEISSATNPATAKDRRPPPIIGPIRPALPGDPSTLSQSELVAGGYPPRPDPTAAPGAYSAWLDVVHRPMTVVTAAPIPTKFRGSTTSNASYIWSGAVVKTGSYDYVVGQWTHPTVTAETNLSNGKCDWMAVWVGIDGYLITANQGLIQDGSWSQICRSNNTNMLSAFAWDETLPAAANQLFSIAAGDSMFAATWEGDSTGGIALSLTTGWFFVADLTSGIQHYESMPTPTNTCGADHHHSCTITGATAEWIVERPCLVNTCPYWPLANYGTMSITNAYAESSTWTPYFSDNNIEVVTMRSTLFNSSLSTPTISTTAPTINFTWKNFF